MGWDLDPVDWAKGAYHGAKRVVDDAINWTEAGLDDVVHALAGLVTLPDDALEEVIKALGLPWPDADENALRTMAATYTSMAGALDTLIQGTSPSVMALVNPANNDGKSVLAIEAFWAQYDSAAGVPGGPGATQGTGWLPETSAACRAQADACTKLAAAVEHEKTVAKATIMAMAAVILVGVGLLVVPGVDLASGPAIAAATEACTAAVSTCLVGISDAAATIIANVLVNAAINVVVSITLDLAVAQPVKMAMGAQSGWNLSSLKSDALYGAFTGGAFGGLSSGARYLPELTTQLDSAAPALTGATTSRLPALLDSSALDVAGDALPSQNLAVDTFVDALEVLHTLDAIQHALDNTRSTDLDLQNDQPPPSDDDDPNACEGPVTNKNGHIRNWALQPFYDSKARNPQWSCRATGADADLDEMDYGQGTETNMFDRPPGYYRVHPANNGHLVASVLGGSGTTMQNLVPLYAVTNQEVMKPLEMEVRDAISYYGDKVHLYVAALYDGPDPAIPSAIVFKAYSTESTHGGKLDIDCIIGNSNDPNDYYCYKNDHYPPANFKDEYPPLPGTVH